MSFFFCKDNPTLLWQYWLMEVGDRSKSTVDRSFSVMGLYPLQSSATWGRPLILGPDQR